MKEERESVLHSPLKLLKNRVCRSYKGGKLIEQWQGMADAKDNNQPEEWVASLVEARNSAFIQDEGLSKVEVNGAYIKLIDLIGSDSNYYLGAEHIKKHGTSMAVLTKVLDASVRLSIQVHPTKDYARTHFNSEFGKTEAWYILGGREVSGEAPYVLAGFKPGVSKALWKKYFEEQDIEAMIASLHKFYIKAGDVVLIEGGLPHAIGSGCFLIEIQEPTDYTMRIERKTMDGNQLPDMLCHQGVGFEKMLDCFNYDELSEEETRLKCFKNPAIIWQEGKNTLTSLISDKDTPCFSMNKLSVRTSVAIRDASFKTCIVLGGSGCIEYQDGCIDIRQSDTFFLPAGLCSASFINKSETPLEIILCYPPP